MDLTVLAHLRQEHDAVHADPLHSVAFANKVLQQLRQALSESDGSPVCLGISFIKPPGVSDRYPALEESVENGHLAEEVQDWDWRRWFAALPMKNYDSFTGGTGILDFGLRPIDGTVDPNGSGPIWDFYLVLDKQPPVTVHIHPGAEDKLVTRWSTRTDRERASDQTALTAVNPNCGESAFLIMYESCPLDPPKLVAPSYGFEHHRPQLQSLSVGEQKAPWAFTTDSPRLLFSLRVARRSSRR
jgi:hypothetical protein